MKLIQTWSIRLRTSAWSRTASGPTLTKFDDAPPGFFPKSPDHVSSMIYNGSLYDQILAFQPVWPSTILMKRSFFDRIGGFREELGRNPSEDLEFTLRCVREGATGIIRDPVVGVRRHEANFSRDMEANARGQIEVMEYALQHHDVTAATRAILLHQIELRHVELSYGAFRRGEFSEVVARLSNLQSAAPDRKTHLKLLISRVPLPFAKLLQSALLH